MKINLDARDKWGAALDGSGFQIIPNQLLAQQKKLGIPPTALVVLLHLNRFWWKFDQNPYPSATLIADQMGLHIRSVERHLQHLEEKGLIRRLGARKISGKLVRPISLIPLADQLNRIIHRERDLQGKKPQLVKKAPPGDSPSPDEEAPYILDAPKRYPNKPEGGNA